MIQTALITGTSSGLGKALAKELLSDGCTVFGISRRSCGISHSNYHHRQLDLSHLDKVSAAFNSWPQLSDIDLIILNAGLLGHIEEIREAEIKNLQKLMTVNLWANKALLDSVFGRNVKVKQVIAISSGASVNPFKGWSGYAISKTALNMMIKLYAFEIPETHFCPLAPGLVDTGMQDYISTEADSSRFSGIQRLIDAKGTDAMPPPEKAARKILDTLPKIIKLTSGEYADIRKL